MRGNTTNALGNPGSGRRRRPSLAPAAGDVSDRILSAAEACFRDAGYERVSIREIAERAGVSKSLVLYHFESKEHVFAELQLRIYRRLAKSVSESARASEGSAHERARVALESLMAAVREGNDLAAHAMLSARALTNPESAPHVRRMRHELRELLGGTMREIFGNDAERLPLSLEAAGDLLWAALTGLGLQSVIDASPSELERGFDSLRTIVALAFSARPEEA